MSWFREIKKIYIVSPDFTCTCGQQDNLWGPGGKRQNLRENKKMMKMSFLIMGMYKKSQNTPVEMKS